MKIRKLKNGNTRHYCENCHAPIYDERTKSSGIFILGTEISETKIVARYKAFCGGGLRIAGKRYGELCADCIQKLQKK